MIEDLIPVAKDIHSIYNFLTNGGLEKVTFYISAKEMNAVRTIIKGISGEILNLSVIRNMQKNVRKNGMKVLYPFYLIMEILAYLLLYRKKLFDEVFSVAEPNQTNDEFPIV